MGRRTIIDGRYELDPLSRRAGGMGEIWFGYDQRLDRQVAIKFIRIDKLPDGKPDKELTQRFVRESRITARLEHPGVPIVYDCGSHGDDLYLVMQLIDGCSISALLDEIAELGEIPVAWAAAIAAQVCSVLAAAHANSLVHRDLKPSNLMLCRDGTVKVLDFGIAAALSSTETKLTRTGVIVGTPEYMAPEQALAGATTPQSDLYSLGVVLDEMLTKKNQFADHTALASMHNHIDRAPQPLRTRRQDIPEDLERLVLWLLAKAPEKRPATAGEVYDRLLNFCHDLPPFPGYVDLIAPYPVRMYATVVGRIAPRPALDGHPQVDLVRPAVPPLVDIGLSDIALARKDAGMLKAKSRFSQAAEVLAKVIEPATHAFGFKSADVLDVRIELADVLFLGGDYRRAGQEFGKLAADLAEWQGPENDLVLRCRLMQASCHAAVGETAAALVQLGQLLDDEKRFGVDEERILELRRQIGLLELGSGHRSQARRILGDLLPDMEKRYGPHHPSVKKVREILDGLDGER